MFFRISSCILPKRCATVQYIMQFFWFVLIVALLLGGAIGIVIVLPEDR